MKNKFIRNIRSFMSDDTKVMILSCSSFLLSMFTLFLSYSTNSNSLKTQRSILSSIFLFIWFYLFPFMTMDKKDKTIKEFSILIGHVVLGYICLYILLVYTEEYNSNFLIDLIFSIILLRVIYYIILRLFFIFKTMLKLIDVLTAKLFPDIKNDNTKGKIGIYIERLTTIILSISGLLGTILAIAKSVESLINIGR